MIFKRLYCSKPGNVSPPELIKYIERAIINISSIHSDIFQRQDYIQRQINDVFFSLDYQDKDITSIKESIDRIHIRLSELEQKNEKNKKWLNNNHKD